MKENRLSFKTLLLLIIILASSCGIVYAQPPPIPSDYSGYVTVNDEPAPDGAVVYAKIEDYTSDSVAVANGGQYRFLIVEPPNDNYLGKTIEFYVDLDAGGPLLAVMAEETSTFEQGTSHETFDLTVVRAPGPGPGPGPGPANEPPVADAGSDKTVYVDTTVHFSGVGSQDPDGTIVSYEWDFGDGDHASGVEVAHIYTEAGIYAATLTVTDDDETSDSDSCTVTVQSMQAPLATEVVEAVPANQTGYVVDASAEADTTVTVNTTAPVNVTVLRYEGNPHPEDPMPEHFVPKFVDVSVSDSDAVVWPIYVEMFYTDEEAEGLDEDSLGIYYWKDGAWRRCSNTGVDTERNVVWAYMTRDEASGSPILIGGNPFKPAEFEVSDLSITPAEVEPGEEVTVSVLVSNVGEETVSYTVTLRMENGLIAIASEEEVTLEGGASEIVSFTFTMNIEGTYNVEVDGLTGSFEVVVPVIPKPAEFEVSDLTISPEEVEEGLEVEISVKVSNIGEEYGSHTVELKLDGAVVDSDVVDLNGGDSETVTFRTSSEVEGRHTVEIDGFSDSFTVKAPPPPKKPIGPWIAIAVIVAITIFLIWRRISEASRAEKVKS